MKKGSHMTEESKKKLSEAVSKRWKEKGKYGNYGVHQKDSEESYRTYQRLQHRDWYARNKEKWSNYIMKKKYEAMSTEELFRLRDKHANGMIAGNEKKQRLVNLITSVLVERGVLTVTCDFEHNYSYSACNPANFEMPKPDKIEINGVWYDLVECPIQWEG